MRSKNLSCNKVEALCNQFEESLVEFEQRKLFTGPSVFFHRKCIEIKRKVFYAGALLNDPVFLEYLYATLTSWGMHRMGPGMARLVEFDRFCLGFQRMKGNIGRIEQIKLWDIQERDLPDVMESVWWIIYNLNVGISGVKLVGGSKALHHILPDLVPPIDREYTLNFFRGNGNIGADGEKEFKNIFPWFHYFAVEKRGAIEVALERGGEMNTSLTKVIDNAIVGFQKIKERPLEPDASKVPPNQPPPLPPTKVGYQELPKGEGKPICFQILGAVKFLVSHGKERFTRLDVRETMQIERVRFEAVNNPIFQGMRADQPGGAPAVNPICRGIFRRVERGLFELTDYGKEAIQGMNNTGTNDNASLPSTIP